MEITERELVGSNPFWNGFFQAFGADEVGGDPDGFERLDQVRVMILRRTPGLAARRLFSTIFFERQKFKDSVFAMILTDLTEFMKDARLILIWRLFDSVGQCEESNVFWTRDS